MTKSINASARIAIALLAGVSGGALAQEAPPPAETDAQTPEDAGTDIVITAQKRSERLQDVPISVSALGGDALQQQRVNQADDLVTKIPNLQLTSTVGENTPIFALRGVSMSDYSLNQSGPVATYYDEVYKGNFAFLGVALFDLERVEVLRGPQGTLYGKNTTGGAVNLISRVPTFDPAGYFNIGYGNYDRIDANGAINVPLGSKLAARVAFTFARADGWFKNRLAGEPDLNSVREYGIRASLLFEPSDRASFTLRASTSLQNPRNYGVFADPGPDGVGAGVYELFGGASYFRTGLKRREIEANYTDRRRARTYAVSLTGNVDLSDTLTLTSVTSYDKGTLFIPEDTDGSPKQTLEIPYVDRANQFAQDLRLTSDMDGPFNFILGAYYNREDVFNRTEFGIFKDIDVNGDGAITAQDCADGFPLACLVTNSFDQLKHSYALYSDMRLNVAEGVTLRGGLRYTHDDGRLKNFIAQAIGVDGVPVVNLIPGGPIDATTGQRFKTDNISGKIGIDYKTPGGSLIYANYSRGYRARSFNAQAFFDPSELSIAKPEKIDAFELGAKTQFADRRVTLNGAAFYYRYGNQQFIDIDPVTAAQKLVNLERSRIMGAELELSARPIDALSLNLGLGLLDTKIEKGMLRGVSVVGNELSNAPAVTLSAGLGLTAFDNDRGKLSVNGDMSYSSSQFFEVLNVERLRQKGYVLLGGHIDYQSADGHWTASLWGKNLTDKFYFTSRVDLLGGFGFDYNHVGGPRSYGVTIGYKY